MKIGSGVVAAVLLLALPSHAQTQAEMNAQSGADYKKADARLNETWKKAAKALSADKGRFAKLKTAQKAWLTFRDAACEFEASEVEGGTMEPAVRVGCLTRLTEQRTKDLEAAAVSN